MGICVISHLQRDLAPLPLVNLKEKEAVSFETVAMDKGTLAPEIDVSIVEISEESDGVLLQSFKDDLKDVDLSISPLKFSRSGASAPSFSNHVHRQISPPDILKHAKGQRPHCLPCEDDQNKENFDMVSENNLGMPTFPKELAPRRKRKAGGCNLRKSLAWNRAFLTEEGILNHEELSILSGAFSDSTKTLLSGINEGDISYVLHSSLSDQSDLKVPEENLFRGLSASSVNRDQKLGSISSMSESSTQEDPLVPRCLKCPLQASRKVNLAKGNNRSVARGGCYPQQLASYSQKRLTNVNTTNASSKIPKLSTCKIDTPLLCLPPKDATLANNHLHCNQNSPPVYDEKNLKYSSVNAKRPVTCTAWSATSAKPCSGKYMVKQPSKMPITSLLQTPQVVKGTVDLKVDPEPIPHAADIHAPTPAGLADPIKVEVSFPQHHSFNFGNISSGKYDSKPSGLRMPSPSLGYFSQARASAGHRFPLQKVSQLCNLSKSSNPTPKKSDSLNHIGELRPPYAADQRLSKHSSSTTITITNAAVSLGTQNVSSLKGAISSTVNPCLTLKTNSEAKELQQVAVRDLPDSGSCNKSSSPEQLYGDCSGLSDIIEEQSGKQALNMPELDETRKISHQEEVTSQMSDGALITESGCSERSQQSLSFVNHSVDVPLSRDFGGTQLSSPHALPQQSIAKKVKAGVSGIYRDADINEPHVEANSFKNGPVDDEYYRASNVDLSAEQNNIDKGTYLEAESSLMSSQEQVTAAGVARSFKSDCSSEKLDPSLQATSQLHGSVSLVHDNGLMSDLLHEESQHALSGNCKQLNGHENQLEIDSFPAKDKMASRPAGIIRSLVDDSKKDLAPFSDGWLAARVAAGDDILSIKTGAVQNSPPDKSVQEPGPWSPVKRNAQDVGPFDCTKYTSLSTT